ncbi:hypothetical protein D3C80_1638730 [compost metagenome]
MREHVHHQIGIREAPELAVNLVLRGTGVTRLYAGYGLYVGLGQWPAQVLARIEQLPCRLVAARTAAGLLLPDVEHGAIAMRQQLLLAGRAATEHNGRQQHGGRFNPDPRHGLLRFGGSPDAPWRRSQ